MLQDPAAAAADTANHRFPCPTCGADLRFDPPSGGLKCQHCGHEEAIPERRGGISELDLRAVEQNTLPPAELQQVRYARCPSCGAQVELGTDEHARECPFCASPIVTDTGLDRQIKPQAQLPFLLSEEDARTAMNRWLGRLWFAPNDLRQYARANRAMQGIYAPYWTYDAQTRSDYTGKRGTVYYETRPVSVVVNGRRQTRMQQVARVRWSPARGRVARAFDDVLVLGSTSLPKHFTDAIAPWDLSTLTAYEPKYLAGFRAEGYTVPVEQGYGEARQIMNAVIEQDVRHDIGGDQQQIRPDQDRRRRADLQACPAAGLARRLPLPGPQLPLRGQRPHRRGRRRAAVFGGQDRHRHRHRPDHRRADRLCPDRRAPRRRLILWRTFLLMPLRRALLVMLCAALPAAAQEPPPALVEATEEASALCRDLGGTPKILDDYATSRDLNGDGRADFVTDLGKLECEGAWGAFCGTGGCPASAWLSAPGDSLGPLRLRPAARPRRPRGRRGCPARGGRQLRHRLLRRRPSRRLHPHLELRRQRPGKAADRRAAGTRHRPGRRLRRRLRGRTPSRPVAPGWTLRRVPGGSPVALGGGVGDIASLSAFCLEGQPFLAVAFLKRPAADRVALDFAFSEGKLEARAGYEATADGAYVVDLADGPLADRLGGHDSEVAVSVDGTSQGTLSLSGSTRAIRGALDACR